MKKILIAGGDSRLLSVREELLRQGLEVSTLGLYEGDGGSISDADIIILPVPTTRDGKTVFTPLTGRHIPLSDIEKSGSGKLLLTCNYRFRGCNCIDYGAQDSYSLLNAVPTAEGAIKLAIENTPHTIWKSRSLVIGCGRVGKVLADRLRALGSLVTVSARKDTDFAMLDAFGFSHLSTPELDRVPLGFDMIFNTVDAPVLSDAALERCEAGLIIDLSSAGGLNPESARARGITAIKAPSLPVSTAPLTAGKILCETLTGIIKDNLKE